MGINFSSIEMKVIRESLYIFMFVKDVVKQSFGLILCVCIVVAVFHEMRSSASTELSANIKHH